MFPIWCQFLGISVIWLLILAQPSDVLTILTTADPNVIDHNYFISYYLTFRLEYTYFTN